jgi:hypothetical protein
MDSTASTSSAAGRRVTPDGGSGERRSVHGHQDRSWGVRRVGEPAGGGAAFSSFGRTSGTTISTRSSSTARAVSAGARGIVPAVRQRAPFPPASRTAGPATARHRVAYVPGTDWRPRPRSTRPAGRFDRTISPSDLKFR